ncbi:hypothetical protein AG1IA_02399 [Rhizoctonia solani AG-1 IA]|uniref:Uncharacterized protein n=1 Tax=Thanatephorus cucumeris (strain AG1-IA) TaxID=983506 RepID=L8X391_THACA|nr:hypothetical protein AG1IA_02399 [Rhizoctonia solani AG-1 IA]
MSFQQLDNPFDGGGLTPPPGYVVPSFPSLYDPRFDFGDNDPNNPSHLSAESRETTQTRSDLNSPHPRDISLHSILDTHILCFFICIVRDVCALGPGSSKAPCAETVRHRGSCFYTHRNVLCGCGIGDCWYVTECCSFVRRTNG